MFYTVNLSQNKSKQSSYLSTTLLEKMQQNLDDKKKIILYLNKRGSFSSLICEDCGYLHGCPNCDTSFSVHSHPPKLLCHLCGNTDPIPLKCKKCSGTRLKNIGVGTQQIEEILGQIFSKNTIYRFDSDSVKTKTEKKAALEKLVQTDIIIGTKMITTGFDFEKVWLIGVILLEQELSYPQFNIEEKVYTNMKQLIGRGERNGEKTDIVLQTFMPENELVQMISEGNYKDFFTYTLTERKLFGYPPFTQMITLEYRDVNKQKAETFMQMLDNKLQLLNKEKKFNIQFVSLPFKKNNQYHYKIILKGDDIRNFLKNIEIEIMRNSKLSVVFY